MSTAALSEPLFGLDYTDPIPAARLRACGVKFVVRYLSRYTPKVLTSAEAHELESAGIGIALVFEDAAQRSLEGEACGEEDGRFALAQATGIFGSDRGGSITFAVDFDTAGRPEATDPYFDGVARAIGLHRSGPYGCFDVVRHHADRGYGALWQTYAWSGGQLDRRAQIYQYSNAHDVGGTPVDYDHVYYADYGQWTGMPDVDPYAIYPDAIPGLGSERAAVRETDRLLTRAHQHVATLADQAHPALKRFRDRIWRVSHFEPPEFDRRRAAPDWDDFARGERWQEINRRMKTIEQLRTHPR